jgi:hypothetical protein
MAEAVPSAPPGTHTRYHILSFGWIVKPTPNCSCLRCLTQAAEIVLACAQLGGLIRAVTGRHMRDILREDIAGPLGLGVRSIAFVHSTLSPFPRG